MVLPIILGVGATIVALTARVTISTARKFQFLTPQMIASLNNIKVPTSTSNDPQIQHIRQTFPNEGFKSKMTEQEALQILGIQGDDILKLNKQMVKERYRKLIIVNHPDREGSQYLSQKINEAKGVLDRSVLVK